MRAIPIQRLKEAERLVVAGHYAAAREVLEPILRRFPANPAARRSMATAWYREGLELARATRYREAVARLRPAAELAPQDPLLHNDLGAALEMAGELDAAIAAYGRACSLSDRPDYLANQAAALQRRGDVGAARGVFARLAAHPLAVDRDRYAVRAALLLPAIVEDEAEIERARAAVESALDALLARGLAIDSPERGYVTPFFLSYHGRSNRELLCRLARLFRRAAPSLSFIAPHCARYAGAGGRRIRIGLISRHLHNHSIGHTTRGLVSVLDRGRFEVLVLRIPPFVDDAVSRSIDADADRVVRLPAALPAMREAIAGLELDVLFYQDIGMEPLSYFLAFARLAPVQCVSFGHPDTSGIDTVDWFVSSTLFEPEDDPAADYSERLYRIPEAGTLAYYLPPEPPAELHPRAGLGLADAERVYLCAQTLFKVHPAMDRLLRGILERDAGGRIVLIEANEPQWTRALEARLARHLGAWADRVRFVPRLAHGEYLSLIAAADVVLDTVAFNGMNTSLEAFAIDRPVVTLPGRLQRSRHTAGMYRRMGLDRFIAASESHYVELAVRAATDAQFAAEWRMAIAVNKSKLYRDASVVRGFETFFATAVAEAAASGRAGERPLA